ncbi:unnamed protein product [Aureobasidium uvarum]|uniref:Uncharacterized protein n=1 Tax=Aureobasidium uvarum TaxID=2773716 RepID=A0A9N8PRR0_9PEZI|nr:unnamed protein product [Aureobasidium uvarum]
MPPTKSQKVAKVASTEDGSQGFVEKQNELYKVVKARQDEARSKIRKSRTYRNKDLQARIKALKRGPTTKQPGSNADAPSSDHTAFGSLRDLLARKTDIERRITESINVLEAAMRIASSELQIVLKSRSELSATATMPAKANAATADSNALVVQQ